MVHFCTFLFRFILSQLTIYHGQLSISAYADLSQIANLSFSYPVSKSLASSIRSTLKYICSHYIYCFCANLGSISFTWTVKQHLKCCLFLICLLPRIIQTASTGLLLHDLYFSLQQLHLLYFIIFHVSFNLFSFK